MDNGSNLSRLERKGIPRSIWKVRRFLFAKKFSLIWPNKLQFPFKFPFSLAFSVTIFCSEAAIAIIILLMRRSKAIGGELGGPPVAKYITAAALFGLWLIYLTMSSLEAYGYIKFGAKA